MNDPLENYKEGALWRARGDIVDVVSESNFKKKTIKKNDYIFILEIVEEFSLTHIKFLHNKEVCYVFDLEDIRINFIY